MCITLKRDSKKNLFFDKDDILMKLKINKTELIIFCILIWITNIVFVIAKISIVPMMVLDIATLYFLSTLIRKKIKK